MTKLHGRGGKREGAGRPRKVQDRARITIDLERTTLEKLDEFRHEKSRAEFLRELITNCLG